ncbi:MAG: VOC family protein [Planctomycetota bacterium]
MTMRLGYLLLYVEDVEKTIDFYESAFGLARKLFMAENDQVYGELETGETTIGLVSYGLAEAQGIPFSKADPNAPAPAMDIGFVTDNVDDAYARAIDHGAVSVAAPERKPWGQTVSYVRDLNGFLVGINSPVTPPPQS